MSDAPVPPTGGGGQIFISHSSRDGKMAQTISAALERRGYRCWISSRDIGPGENFQEAIVHAIRGSRVMVLVFTGNANNSNEIKKEMALASQHNLAVIPLRVEDVVPNDAFAYEFATRQWIDAFGNWDQAVDRLSQQVNMVLRGAGAAEPAPHATAAPPPPPVAPALPRAPSRAGLIAACVVVLLAVIAAGAYVAVQRTSPAAPPVAATAPQPSPAPPPQAVATPPAPAPAAGTGTVVGQTFRDCADCPEMVVIPAGEFAMGNAYGPATERPVHLVRVTAPFAIGKFHVTRRDYARFVEATKREGDGCDIRRGETWIAGHDLSWRDAGFAQAPRHPVVCVSWDDAVAYAQWLSRISGKTYRLPTEAEWEYAARASTTTRFYWGEDQSLICRYENDADQSWEEQFHQNSALPCRDGYAFTSPVGTFAPNQFGLHDMLGNAFQWVADCWTDSYDGAPTEASVAVAPGGACPKIARGGSWNRYPNGVRVSFRLRDDIGRKGAVIGFRVARDLGDEPRPGQR